MEKSSIKPKKDIIECQNKVFAVRFREELEKKDISQAEIAKKINVSRQTINSWCLGYVAPDIDKLLKISNELKISCNYLLGITETPKAENESIKEQLGLSDEAIDVLKHCNKLKEDTALRAFSVTQTINYLLQEIAITSVENEMIIKNNGYTGKQAESIRKRSGVNVSIMYDSFIGVIKQYLESKDPVEDCLHGFYICDEYAFMSENEPPVEIKNGKKTIPAKTIKIAETMAIIGAAEKFKKKTKNNFKLGGAE